MVSDSLSLRRVRGVADVLRATVRFAGRYWRLLLKSLLALLVPSVALGYLFFAGSGLEGMMTYMLDPDAVMAGEVPGADWILVGAVGSSTMNFVGSALGMTAVLSVVRLHEERGAEASIAFRDVLAHTKQRVLRVIGTQVAVMMAIGFGGLLLVGGTQGLVSAVGGALGGATAVVPVLAVGLFIGGFVFLLVRYLFITIPVQVLADVSFVEGFRRTGAVVRGHFVETAAVAILTFMLVFLLSAVFFLPLQAVQGLGGVQAAGTYPTWLRGLFLMLLVLANVGSILAVALQALAGALQFYSLDERVSR